MVKAFRSFIINLGNDRQIPLQKIKQLPLQSARYAAPVQGSRWKVNNPFSLFKKQKKN